MHKNAKFFDKHGKFHKYVNYITYKVKHYVAVLTTKVSTV